ncbi:MAG: alpha/beta hydrolase [Candidatus Tectomicrobia bacterium]|uniref:Alpha/beta hydrolase n=1 Tax=Tectimicrobiota bacterium TaxID=2528274 RepID=A0A938B148_UNCTE|nr:alpha/beta hydrolase [Candidatus Tectomicrobia bacterium]
MGTSAFGQDKFVSINGLQLHYVEWGSPTHPALVLLHGFQSNAHTWDTFSHAMADSYHVLALDQRGHGDTSWAPDGNYTPEASVADIAAFITALHLAPAVVIGHSMGGRHAALVAAEHPTLVNKVVIVDTAAEFPPALLARLAQPPATAAPLIPETFATFEGVVANGMQQYPLTPEAELRHANYHNLTRGADGQWRWRWDIALLEWRRLHQSLRQDLYASLKRIQCPTLLIRGQHSPLLTPEVAEKMIQALPDGRLVEVARAAHTVNADNAAEFNAVTAAFLKT